MEKKIKAIPNVFEGEEPAKPFELPALSGDVRTGFLESGDLSIIEEGIRTIERTSGMLRIIQGIAILKAESLWDQSGLSSLKAYREEANKRYGLSRASISNLRKMAYAWSDYTRYLRKLDMTGKTIHLLYLDEAIQRHQDKKLVFDHFKNDTQRDFVAFARGEPAEEADPLPDVELTVKGWKILLDDKVVMAITDTLPDEEKDFLARTLRAAYKARTGNRLAHVVAVYDEGEARAVDNFLKKHRAGK